MDVKKFFKAARDGDCSKLADLMEFYDNCCSCKNCCQNFTDPCFCFQKALSTAIKCAKRKECQDEPPDTSCKGIKFNKSYNDKLSNRYFYCCASKDKIEIRGVKDPDPTSKPQPLDPKKLIVYFPVKDETCSKKCYCLRQVNDECFNVFPPEKYEVLLKAQEFPVHEYASRWARKTDDMEALFGPHRATTKPDLSFVKLQKNYLSIPSDIKYLGENDDSIDEESLVFIQNI